jgi:hypothetical protein
MLIFAIYGAVGSTGSAATTTVADFITQVAFREAREGPQHDKNMRALGFYVFATCRAIAARRMAPVVSRGRFAEKLSPDRYAAFA